jgi:hypothetical protein
VRCRAQRPRPSHPRSRSSRCRPEAAAPRSSRPGPRPPGRATGRCWPPAGARRSGWPACSSTGRTWAAVAVALLLLTAWLLRDPGGAAIGATAPGTRTSAAAADGHPPAPAPPHAPLPPAKPLRVDIASIGLHADVVGRGLRDGTVDPPPYDTPDVAGWYRDGPAPGSPGAALLVGHVDTETGAAVFYTLATVRPGAPVDVTRSDGTVARFTVDAVETVPKTAFDPAHVYGYASPAPHPELRLITCGGTFDPATRTYSANVVVYATLTASHPV